MVGGASKTTQAKGGQGGKGPIQKQSREEKTKGGKEQEEERPGPVGIRARTNDWERRFRQEVLVAQSASIPRRKVRSAGRSRNTRFTKATLFPTSFAGGGTLL